jgi:hypothetical protein
MVHHEKLELDFVSLSAEKELKGKRYRTTMTSKFRQIGTVLSMFIQPDGLKIFRGTFLKRLAVGSFRKMRLSKATSHTHLAAPSSSNGRN